MDGKRLNISVRRLFLLAKQQKLLVKYDGQIQPVLQLDIDEEDGERGFVVYLPSTFPSWEWLNDMDDLFLAQPIRLNK